MSRAALPMIAAAVLTAAGGLHGQQSDTTRNPLAGRSDSASAGRVLYAATCQSCHGPAGQGERGPALNQGVFVHGNADGDLFHSVRAGIPGTQMPAFPRLNDEQIWQLVAYIRTLPTAANGPGAAASPIGNAAAGETLFFGRAGCAACHQVNGRGGIVGPDLSTAARLAATAVR